jgi:hypothetical protein
VESRLGRVNTKLGGKKMPNKTITASASGGGSISPSGSVQVPVGNNQTFTMTANTNYKIGTEFVDGVPIMSSGLFCAISGGSSGSTAASTSSDGITWTTRTLPSSKDWRAIAWNSSIFCAISGGSSGSNVAATSVDGIV